MLNLQPQHHKTQMAQLLDGRKIAGSIKQHVREQVSFLDPKPGLAVILVGQDPASHLYVNLKKKACDFADIVFSQYTFDQNCADKTIIEAIEFLNQDPQTNGILVQLPLPGKHDTDKIIQAIDPRKDVDGFHPQTIERLKQGRPAIISPLALGIDALIKETKTELKNKVITVLCNHEIFAEPFIYLYGKDNKVQVTTVKDELHQEKCHLADILIVAVGQPKYITNNYIKKDAIVIDVGINDLKDQTVGDVDFEEVILKAKHLTPVPGGVGPMTVALLLENVLKLYQEQNK